ncbi:uncharacterized protein IWZ02DRAFT_430506 [Phyllosticta citriasiana]|uniref:uncharacterized protein n=1 Tax=Phyllosticta citriasiana TaxID=595635 RepID=UPI0030FDBF7C
MKKKLNEILWRAGNVHFCLLTHQASFTWIGAQLLLGKKYLQRNKQMVPDRSQEGDSLEGNEVRIVVGTNLLAWGDTAGDAYSKWRVVVPASVFLKVDRDSLQESRDTEEKVGFVVDGTSQGNEDCKDFDYTDGSRSF